MREEVANKREGVTSLQRSAELIAKYRQPTLSPALSTLLNSWNNINRQLDAMPAPVAAVQVNYYSFFFTFKG